MNAQMDFLAVLDAPAARVRDPSTSHSAARLAKQMQTEHATLILGALQRFGAMGVDRIGDVTKLAPHAVGKRMCELQRAGAVELTGRNVPSNSGREQREWRRRA